MALPLLAGWLALALGFSNSSGFLPRLGKAINRDRERITLQGTTGLTQLFERCQAHRVDPARLIFKLTETSAMDDRVAFLDLLTRLQMIGFHLSIDDFGTGFSSMTAG